MESTDIGFPNASKFEYSFEACRAALKTPQLKPVADWYASNMWRVHAMAMTPGFLINQMSLLYSATVQVGFHLHKRLIQDPDELSAADAAALAAERSRFIAHTLKDPDALVKMEKNAAHNLKMIIMQHEGTREGAKAFLASMIIGAWSAFETLTGDLWIAALNAHPRGLADLSGKKDRIQGTQKRKGEPGTAVQEGKMVQLEWLRAASDSYDLSDKMGTVLSQRYKFSTLDGIRAAYSLAIANHAHAIDSALSNKTIDALQIVRNIIVHRAGTADADYVKRSRSAPLAPQLKDGDDLELTGDLVSSLISPVADCGGKLLTAVDVWLSTHP